MDGQKQSEPAKAKLSVGQSELAQDWTLPGNAA